MGRIVCFDRIKGGGFSGAYSRSAFLFSPGIIDLSPMSAFSAEVCVCQRFVAISVLLIG